MSTKLRLDTERLLSRLKTLGAIGADSAGGRTRLALTPEDKAGRDLVSVWMREANANVCIDTIGNICGILSGRCKGPPIMIGSHIDTVVSAGALDGCYGVIAGIEVLSAFSTASHQPEHAIAICAFTNEEGIRFQPDLLGSRVMAGEIDIEEALAICAIDTGTTVAQELKEIGYAGATAVNEIRPCAFLELHIEQGPVLDANGLALAIVESVQGHSWWRINLRGSANHAGTTPMSMRRDAGFAAMSLATRLTALARDHASPSVATVGCMEFRPNAINVVPGQANFTVDFRDPKEEALDAADSFLRQSLDELRELGIEVESESLSRHAPVHFDRDMCDLLETLADDMQLQSRRMVSGASHDAQVMAGICPAAMIFVPSVGGVSHNPAEFTNPEDLAGGAAFLLNAVTTLDQQSGIT